MAKKSTLSGLILTLGLVTLVAALCLGGGNVLTEGPIAASKQERVISALREVLPEFDNDPSSEKREVDVEGGKLTLYPASKGGQAVGTAVETFSPKGFGGEICIMVGFDEKGDITGYSVLQHAETPGLGDRMVSWFKPPVAPTRSLVERIFGFTMPVVEKKSNVYGLNPARESLSVSKDGGQVDAITAATISSRAFLDALNRAANVLNGGDGSTGASTSKKDGATGASSKQDKKDGSTGASTKKNDGSTGASAKKKDGATGASPKKGDSAVICTDGESTEGNE